MAHEALVATLRERLPHLSVHRVPAARAAHELALDVAQRLAQAIALRSRAVLSVSGGRSPVAFFQALRGLPLDWSKVVITLVDDRCVPTDHPDSNTRLVREHLLQGAAASARLLPLVGDDFTFQTPLQGAVAHAEAALAQADEPQAGADVTVLGMGADGHTASLFPGAPGLTAALDRTGLARCVGVVLPQPPANAPFDRISQTLAHLLRSRHLVLPLSGADKLATLAQVAAAPAATERWPVSHVLQARDASVALWLTE